MTAHLLDQQADLLRRQAEGLRGEAGRIEHGGDLSRAQATVPVEESDRVLPRLARVGGQFYLDPPQVEGDFEGNEPEAWVLEWLGGFHAIYREHPRFVEVYNEHAAGKAPTHEAALAVSETLREMPDLT